MVERFFVCIIYANVILHQQQNHPNDENHFVNMWYVCAISCWQLVYVWPLSGKIIIVRLTMNSRIIMFILVDLNILFIYTMKVLIVIRFSILINSKVDRTTKWYLINDIISFTFHSSVWCQICIFNWIPSAFLLNRYSKCCL